MIRRLVALSIVAAAALGCASPGSRQPDAALAPTPMPAERSGATASAAVVDSLYHAAEQEYRHGKWAGARTDFERFILEAGSGDPRATQARFYVAETKLQMGDQLEAARDFRRISDEQPNDQLAPAALLRVGDAFAELWRRPELDPSYGQSALSTYQELLGRYPGSEAAVRAQARIARLNDWMAEKQYKAALYYYRYKAYDSAILYLKDLVATYPRAAVADDALIKLVRAYRILGYQEDATETCGYLRRFHPKADGIGDVCPAGAAAPAAPQTSAR